MSLALRSLLALAMLVVAAAPQARGQEATDTVVDAVPLGAVDFLLRMPQELRGALEPTSIADLVDYNRAGMAAHTVLNRMNGKASLPMLEADSARIITGRGRRLEIFSLPGEELLFLTIETVDARQPDSRVAVYALDSIPQLRPKFWREPSGRELGAADPADILLTEASYAPATQTLTLTSRRPDAPTAVGSVRYAWHPRKGFKLLKK